MLACLALLAVAGAATALRSLSVNESRYTLRTESLFITVGTARLVCHAVLTHTISRAITKREGLRVGKFTRFTLESCRAVEEIIVAPTFLGIEQETLWVLLYRSFAGTLPNILRISYRLEHILMLVEANFSRCLYEGSGIYFWGFAGERDEDSDTLRLVTTLGGLSCPATASIEGIFSIEPELRVTLV